MSTAHAAATRAPGASGVPGTPVPGRIGPNAITRLAEALHALAGRAAAERVFGGAGLASYLEAPPESMVDEREVAALYAALRREPDAALAAAAAREAGERTAVYLLGHRIPRPAQVVLRILPPWAASRLLLAAITRHAWTFAGSARFAARPMRGGLRLTLAGNPMCRGLATDEPACGFYAATFEGLFRALVAPRTRLREIECEAVGAPACVFEARWDGGAGS